MDAGEGWGGRLAAIGRGLGVARAEYRAAVEADERLAALLLHLAGLLRRRRGSATSGTLAGVEAAIAEADAAAVRRPSRERPSRDR